MFVTPELAVGEGFRHYINRQQVIGRLDWIVVDECYVVLDLLGGFRSRILGLRNLMRVETQIVYLTATLWLVEEQQFLELIGLPSKEDCQWFRGWTTRTNIRYQVHGYNIEEEEEVIVKIVEGLKVKYPMPGQIVVFCGTVQKTEQIAKALGAVCFHRNVGSAEEKSRIVKQLTGAQEQVFTATNALGLGVDAATIRAVVHVGRVRKMRHYAQESGRAGRDGQTSEAIIMRGYRRVRGKQLFGPVSGKDVEEEIRELIEGKGCMWTIINKAMDGDTTRVGCEEGEVACQRCKRLGVGRRQDEEQEAVRGEPLEFEPQRVQRHWLGMQEAERQGREVVEVEELVELMEEWRAGCQ